jgi:DNA-binding transcriptional MocR family regulator
MTIWTPRLAESGPRYRAIQAGELPPGRKLPPQRHLADALDVTVGTVSRAYAEAERQGWVSARVGSGTYVRGAEQTNASPFLASVSAEDEGLVDLSLSLPPPHALRASLLGQALAGIAEDRAALERTLFAFSTAKVLAGGLRIGALRVPEALLEPLGAAVRAQSWMVPPLMVEAVCRCVESADAERLLAWQIEEQAERQRLARRWLGEYAPSGRPHGNNLWLTLPEGLRAAELLAALEERGVRLTGPEPFCVGSEPAPQAVRLCLGGARSREALAQALRAVKETLQAPPPIPWRTL